MKRLLIVSNRLPVNVSKGQGAEKWTFQLSSGGLVSALAGLQKTAEFIWIGWPGIDVDESEREEFVHLLQTKHSCYPVFIDQNTASLHYNGFSNSTIWPMFHYLPGDINFQEEQWDGYCRANRIFADYIAGMAADGDVVWIHDYHLMLLPTTLRQSLDSSINVKIGFFLHIPFPTSEVYRYEPVMLVSNDLSCRVLPYRREVLEGLLSSDLIGFHTYDYARHFLTSCTRILGLNTSPTSVEYGDRVVKIGAYPVGVEPEKFAECLGEPQTESRIAELLHKYQGLKIIVGVERLDYIKGLPQKLLAYEEFLQTYPEHVGKVVLIQVAIPSRTDVPEYQKLQNTVFELIGRINGKFSTLNYSPIQFIYNSVCLSDLVALYRSAHVCLVTSTRDGMNLIAYEYVATQIEKGGVLILSEFAGAAQSLNGIIRRITSALNAAINMEKTEQMNSHRHLLEYVTRFTSRHWGESFIEDLDSIQPPRETALSRIDYGQLRELLTAPGNRMLLIVNDADDADQIDCSGLRRGKDALTYIFTLKDKESSESIRDGVGVIAGGGVWTRRIDEGGWKLNYESSELVCSEQVVPILKHYTARVPGSKIEISQNIISWSYKSADPDFAQWIASELQINLEKLIGHLPFKVSRMENALQVMPSSLNLEKIAVNELASLVQHHQPGLVVIVCEAGTPLEKIAKVLAGEISVEVRHYVPESNTHDTAAHK